MNTRLSTFLLLACLVPVSCRFLDIAPLTIISYLPTDSVLDPEEIISVSITFSNVPLPTLAEESFSLTADGISEDGSYTWEGSTMKFLPHAGWKAATDYQVKVDSSVEDSEGHSLRNDFTFQFSTRSESNHPRIIASTPIDGVVMDERRPLITLTFNETMDSGSVNDALRLEPNVSGYLIWDAQIATFTYVLTEDLSWQTQYTMSVSTEAVDKQHNPILDDWTTTFIIGSESVRPRLISLTTPETTATAQEDKLDDDVLTITSGWNSDWPLIFTFSESINEDTVRSNITFDPEIQWEGEWNDTTDVYTITPDTDLDWGKTFAVHLKANIADAVGNLLDKEYHFNLRIDGSKSKPPKIVAAIIYTDLANANNGVLLSPYTPISFAMFGSAPNPIPGSISTGNTVVDIFFDMADGVTPDPLSVAENFSVGGSTGLNDFVALGVALEDATYHPDTIAAGAFGPMDPGVTYDSWLRLIVYINNDDSFNTGIMTLNIAADAQDSAGRSMTESWTMPFQAID